MDVMVSQRTIDEYPADAFPFVKVRRRPGSIVCATALVMTVAIRGYRRCEHERYVDVLGCALKDIQACNNTVRERGITDRKQGVMSKKDTLR